MLGSAFQLRARPPSSSDRARVKAGLFVAVRSRARPTVEGRIPAGDSAAEKHEYAGSVGDLPNFVKHSPFRAHRLRCSDRPGVRLCTARAFRSGPHAVCADRKLFALRVRPRRGRAGRTVAAWGETLPRRHDGLPDRQQGRCPSGELTNRQDVREVRSTGRSRVSRSTASSRTSTRLQKVKRTSGRPASASS